MQAGRHKCISQLQSFLLLNQSCMHFLHSVQGYDLCDMFANNFLLVLYTYHNGLYNYCLYTFHSRAFSCTHTSCLDNSTQPGCNDDSTILSEPLYGHDWIIIQYRFINVLRTMNLISTVTIFLH